MAKQGTTIRRLGIISAALWAATAQGISSPLPVSNEFQPWKSIEAQDGRYYGNLPTIPTGSGGSIYSLNAGGKLRYAWRFPILHNIPTYRTTGANPNGTLAVGQDGAIYGTTNTGGVFGRGILFRLERNGRFSTLHHFESYGNKAVTIVTRDGSVYVFPAEDGQKLLRITRDGSYEYIDDRGPGVVTGIENSEGELILGSQTAPGGNSSSVLRWTEQNGFELLAGRSSYISKLLPLENGGTLVAAGNEIFTISASGQQSTLHEFTAPFEGIGVSALFPMKDGSFTGSTFGGGLENAGTTFRLSPTPGDFGVEYRHEVLGHLPFSSFERSGSIWVQKVFPLRETTSKNHPPTASDDLVSAESFSASAPSPTGLPRKKVNVLANDGDVDGDKLTILSVTNPHAGQVEFNAETQEVFYSAASQAVENDSFRYTISDGNGGESTGTVVIRTNPRGKYTGTISSIPNSETGDPGTASGTLEISVASNRTLVGRVQLLGRPYRFRGKFNEVNQAAVLLSWDRRTNRFASIQLHLKPSGTAWTVEASVVSNLSRFTAQATAQE